MKSGNPIHGEAVETRTKTHWFRPANRRRTEATQSGERRGQSGVEPVPQRTWSERSRRALNVVVAMGLIVVASPLMAIIAVAIRLTSKGPAVFVQHRVGLDRRALRSEEIPFVADRRASDSGGRLFRIFKFRTMYHETDAGRKQVWACEDDHRITPVGRFLRAYRLDELPQLFNVLLGDMNIVGPRPEQPQIFTELRRELDGYRVRQKVLPGITGLAQVNRGYDASMEDVEGKLEYDLEYLERRSLFHDLMIMIKTAPVMLFKRGSR